MLDEIKKVLVREGIQTAAIIDDVYDETPTLDDVDREQWDYFETDLAEVELDLIQGELSVDDVYAELSRLKTDVKFLEFLWLRRGVSEVFAALFKPFQERQDSGKAALAPLELLLTELGLKPATVGARDAETGRAQDAGLIFLDLFLGGRQDEAARDRAVKRVGRIVNARRARPPLVVLMSSSTRLEELRDRCRDEAELLGCQFRTLPKIYINETERLYELLYRLGSRYRDTLRLAAFMDTWRSALDDAAKRFLTKVRRLDLRDYADIQNLVLNSQDERVGTYLLEAYDQFFHHELEGDERLISAGQVIDQISWKDYPPAHFLPDGISAGLVDGLMFHNVSLVSQTAPVQFGDVLFAKVAEAWPSWLEPKVDFGRGERLALLALTQSCDIQQGNAKRMLFLAGVARPAALSHHKRPEAKLTPSLLLGADQYVIEWEMTAPISWSFESLRQNIADGYYQRVRRFRSLYVLQLQQSFASALVRVGTPALMPLQHVAGVIISYRDVEGKVHEVLSASVGDRQAVAMVGRDENKHTDRLVLSPELVGSLKEALRSVAANTLPENRRADWKGAVGSREFFQLFEQGISYERDASVRSLAKTPFDVLQVVGPYAKSSPIFANRTVEHKSKTGPLFIEINFASSSSVEESEGPAEESST
jgi:hypothetical protein